MLKTALCNRPAGVFQAMVNSNLPSKNMPQPLRLFTKTLQIMKLTIFFMMLGLLSANAKSMAQTVTFSGKNVTLATVFDAVEKQTGYTVFANKGLLKDIKPVSLKVKAMPLKDFLEIVFKDQPVDYEISNTTIFIKEKLGIGPQQSNQQPVVQTVPVVKAVEVTGTVLGTDRVPLEGATIRIKGATAATATKAGGKFSINAEPGQTLVISFIGYQTLEVAINGRTNIEIVLKKAEKEIEQVVVTALGIQRRVKALTYNVQEIKGDDLTKASDGSFVNSLNGKVAGVTINASAVGAGGSSRVVMRGTKSISGNNNALYVVDGIPMTNTLPGQPADIFSGAGQTGDFISNINPDDIESVSVLSGPSAAALYGNAAANGVILITTKKGRKDKTDIGIINTTMFSNPLLLPKFQHTYGPSDIGSYFSWGDKLVTPSTYKPEDFFQTGINTTTSVNLSTGTEKNQTYLSLGHVDSKGIIPNNTYDRSNFTARNTSTYLNGKVTLDLSFMATKVNEQNMISQGQYFNPLVAIYLFPAGDQFDRVKTFERYDPSRNLKTQFWPYGDNGLLMQNPYWVTQRDIFENKKDRYIPTISLKYNINNWLSISGRAKMDKEVEKDERRFAASTNTLFASQNGFYALNSQDTRQIYADGLVTINKTFQNKYNVSANIGSSIEDVVYNQYMYGGKLAGVANLYTFADVNTSTAETSQTGYHTQKQSVFASAQFGYKNMVFLDGTARNDWASTLAETHSLSLFYPSVGLSGVLTDLLPMIKSNILPYLKLRGSYSEVGNEPARFLTIPTYALSGGYPGTITTARNPNLKPELTKSWEVGLNASLFKGALKLDGTIYSSSTYNQIFQASSSGTIGSNILYVNAGQVDNKGLELGAKYNHKFGKVEWNSYVNYSLNSNTVVQLLPGYSDPSSGQLVALHLTSLNVGGTGSYKMMLTEGGSMGDIYVNTLKVDEHGAIYVDPGSKTVIADANKFVYAGNNNPKYTASWGNSFKWKGINASFQFNARVGGIVVSNTQAIMDAFGISQASADARDNGGVVVNGYKIPAKEYYQIVGSGAGGGIAAMYTYSATNVRLAEATIGYDFPVKKWVKFVKSANVSLVGRNLLMLYNKAPFDPELTANTQTYYQGIDYFMAPSLRSIGFSVKLNF